jgi:hypothetical protein
VKLRRLHDVQLHVLHNRYYGVICTPGIVVKGKEVRGECRGLHNKVLHDLHFRRCFVRERDKLGVEKTAR